MQNCEAGRRRILARALEGLQHIANDGVGEVAGYAPDGVTVLLDEAAKVFCGLILLAEEDGVVAVKDVAVVGGEEDFGTDGDEVAGGFTGGGVVGEGGYGLGEDGAVKGGVGDVAVFIDNAVLGAGVELADGGLGEGHLGVEG